MTWPDFYLICFLVGFAVSLISLAGGMLHVGLPDLHLDHFHFGDIGHVHADAGASDGLSPFNLGTVSAFLAWFGGTGYLLSRVYGVWFLAALGVAAVSGIGGAAIVFWFVAKVLVSRDENLDPADYDMIGVLGKLSVAIRQGGTGEMVFSQAGTRHVAGARSDTGGAIPRGAEVVVTRYEKGIAYVRRWEDLAGDTAEEKDGGERHVR